MIKKLKALLTNKAGKRIKKGVKTQLNIKLKFILC